jgi:hypothetical protein
MQASRSRYLQGLGLAGVIFLGTPVRIGVVSATDH